MARVIRETPGPPKGTVVPDEVRLYSGDDDVTARYVVTINERTGGFSVRGYYAEPPITSFSIDQPGVGHELRYKVEPWWLPDGSDLGLGPVVRVES